MSFDTPTFWIFFALALIAWRCLPFGWAKTSALLGSLLFYGWWDARYLVLIAASSVIDFVIGARLAASQDPRARKRWLIGSLTANLGLLAVFKYAPFAAENAASIGRLLGFAVDWDLAGWVIPVGISFYTFQTLSYSLDIYRGRLLPAKSFRDFFLFVAFFPQLVAGPIVRANELLPQFGRRQHPSSSRILRGFEHVIVGLFLKMAIADQLAPAVERVFNGGRLAQMSPTEVWLGVVYFSVQIFADFAGYSGIAIGLACLMGLRFPKNFDSPYISRGPSEFWTRWHISLSSWLRDYLYIPLGGNRHGPSRTILALVLTMLIGGLWHGPAWTFVAWGGLHGAGLVVERWLRRGRKSPRRPGRPTGSVDMLNCVAQIAATYVFVLATWVFFRAETFEIAWTMLERMFVAPFAQGDLGLHALGEARHLVLVAVVFAMHLAQLVREWGGARPSPWFRAVTVAGCLFLITVIKRDSVQEFIYFQF